jgi:predicted PurR-regulated permease PerM
MFMVVIAYFLTADGPVLRRRICALLQPAHQQRVLLVWETAIERTGRYIYTRFLLGVVSVIGHTIAFAVIGVPNPIALGLWVGVASQAVPLVGTYLAGALPALVALADSPPRAIAVVVFVTVFQQIENHTLGPMLSRRTVEVHPAVAFGAVIAGTSLIGPIGAVLAVPTVAIVKSLLQSSRPPDTFEIDRQFGNR